LVRRSRGGGRRHQFLDAAERWLPLNRLEGIDV
jgi:hypothetical protein